MSDPTPDPTASPPPSLETIALVRDLMFSSKISAAARLSRIRESVQIIRDPARLTAIDARRLIVDLNAAGHLDAAVAWKQRTGGTVIGFVAHVDGEAIAAARSLGVDRVLSNGGFSANVDAIIRGEREVTDE